jgi:hypothetical protein
VQVAERKVALQVVAGVSDAATYAMLGTSVNR